MLAFMVITKSIMGSKYKLYLWYNNWMEIRLMGKVWVFVLC
jgi:hypothetical protein